MKRFILVESDTEMYSLFASELKELRPGVYEVTKDSPIFCYNNRSQFFGAVSALLVSKSSIEKPEPIALVPPSESELTNYRISVKGEEGDFEPIRATNIHHAVRLARDIVADSSMWPAGTEPHSARVEVKALSGPDATVVAPMDCATLCHCGESVSYVCKHGECKNCGRCVWCETSDRHAELRSDHPEVQR